MKPLIFGVIGGVVGALAISMFFLFMSPINEDFHLEILNQDVVKIRSMSTEEEVELYFEDIMNRPYIVNTCTNIFDRVWEITFKTQPTLDLNSDGIVTESEQQAVWSESGISKYQDAFSICLALKGMYPEEFPQVTEEMLEEKRYKMQAEAGITAPDCYDKFLELDEKREKAIRFEKQLEFENLDEEFRDNLSKEVSQLREDLRHMVDYLNANCYT